MTTQHSDSLVFFGATGDLAYKKIFPALQAMVKRGHLGVPVIGVAKSGWTTEQLRARARDSLEKHGGVDPAAFDKLCGLLRYVDGDYKDPATFQAIRKELGSAQRAAYYLAIPPVLFELVVEQLGKAGCTSGARVVVENHLFQVLTNLAMEPPVRTDSESIRDEKVKVLKAIPPLEAKSIVRGQFQGYRNEPGVAPGSTVETFAALRLEIDSWRWQGVPFYIRAGKCLPVTCAEVVVRLRRPPAMFQGFDLVANYCRFRISPDVAFAIGANVIAPGEDTRSQTAEMLGTRHPNAEEMDAYERVLGDAMQGDATLFAREDYVEEAWRIVDPLLQKATPVCPYEPNTWGPNEMKRVTPPGGWQNPIVAPETSVVAGQAA